METECQRKPPLSVCKQVGMPSITLQTRVHPVPRHPRHLEPSHAMFHFALWELVSDILALVLDCLKITKELWAVDIVTI